jgi:Protein of unknown function (DUF3108)
MAIRPDWLEEDGTPVRLSRQVKKYRFQGFCALLAALSLIVPMLPGPAAADGRLEAQYTMSLAGLPIGRGSWVIDISDSQYSATAKGGTIGLLRAFTGGEGITNLQGTLQGGKPLASIYAAIIKSSKKTDEIVLTVNKGDVKDLKLNPPRDTDAERVPVTEDHQHGILDPMTATLVRMPGTGNLMAPEACQRTLAVFDGRLRYDLQLAYKRMDKVKAEKGYEGPVVVCAVYFTPVAGHIPSRAAIKYMAKLRDIEVWLAPIAGTRVLVPFRTSGPTPVGTAVLEATQFVSVAREAAKAPDKPAKAASTEPKPQ